MWISKLLLRNYKGFKDSGLIEFCKGINVLVGANNAGKSTILKSIYMLQKMNSNEGDIRKGRTHSRWIFILKMPRESR